MNRRTAEVFAAALALPKDDRLGLAEKLLASASVARTTPEWAKAWKPVTSRREAWATAHHELKVYAEACGESRQLVYGTRDLPRRLSQRIREPWAV